MKTATFNKRLVQGTHGITKETKIFTAPTGNIISIDDDIVSILTDDGYTCEQKDILGAVTFH